MTKTPSTSAARCDRIISLIDECLAGMSSSLRVTAGEIDIRPLVTPLRLGLASLSCLALLVTLAIAFRMYRRRATCASVAILNKGRDVEPCD